MFAGFNVLVNSKEKFYSYHESGLSIYNKHKRIIEILLNIFFFICSPPFKLIITKTK